MHPIQLVLLFSVFLQLSAFFTFVSTALWTDELITGLIGQFERYRTGFEALFLFICCVSNRISVYHR